MPAWMVMCDYVIVMWNFDTFSPKWHPIQGRIGERVQFVKPIGSDLEQL
jgi:hypothetical protein